MYISKGKKITALRKNSNKYSLNLFQTFPNNTNLDFLFNSNLVYLQVCDSMKEPFSQFKDKGKHAYIMAAEP